MRLGMVMVMVVVWSLAACEVPNGTYFAVDGEPAAITFDQVEFFLGKDAGGVDRRLHTPARPFEPQQVDPEFERHRMIKRVFTASDVQTTAETRSLTYYLTTETDAPAQYTNYGLVVASRGGVPVGVAEIEDFRVRDDGAYLYEVVLAPIDDGFERWGNLAVPGASCARWTRLRGDRDVASTYAVVRDGDFDCDDVKAGMECDDLNYCAAANTCQGRSFSCIDPVGCNLGVCIDSRADATATTCAPLTCLPDEFCSSSSCNDSAPVHDFFTCAVEIPSSHIEVIMPVVSVGGALCGHELLVTPPPGLPCFSPQIEAPLAGKVGSWTFTVRTANNGSDQCLFNLINPSLTEPAPPEAHLLVSVALATTGSKRSSFVIGFQPSTSAGCVPPKVTPAVFGTSNPTCP